MKLLTAILLTSLLSGCEVFTEYEVDQRLEPFVDQFYHEAAANGVHLKRENLTVQITDLEGNNGLTRHGIQTKVYISRNYFEGEMARTVPSPEYGQLAIERLVFHELGHALLKKEHSTGIMHCCAEAQIEYCTDSVRRSEMIKELFQ